MVQCGLYFLTKLFTQCVFIVTVCKVLFGIFEVLTNTPRGYYDRDMISDIKKRALHRTKILEGQMRGVQKMIENEDYCMDILTQSLAIQKSISSLNKLILENHVRTHIKENLRSESEKSQEQAVEELLGLYELSNVRSK